MPTLAPYPTAQQATPDSCWASAARSITNWYRSIAQAGALPDYPSDQAFASAWAAQTGDAQHADIDVQQSAAAALADLGFDNVIDDHPIPTPAEIFDALNIGEPLLAIVGSEPPVPSPNPAYQNGHWVVIVGIDSAQDDATLSVFNPDNGQINQVPYDPALYQTGEYWQNTSYVSAYSDDQQEPAPPAPATPVNAVTVSPWQGEARGGVLLEVGWQPSADGLVVSLTIAQTGGPGELRQYQAALGFGLGLPPQGIWQFGAATAPLELTLTLSRVPDQPGGTASKINLWASYPLTQAEGVHKVIASWPVDTSQS